MLKNYMKPTIYQGRYVFKNTCDFCSSRFWDAYEICRKRKKTKGARREKDHWVSLWSNESLRILIERPEEERLRPLLGKFWHEIPDSDSPGTRSLDGNGRRKRTFVALYGWIGYQMHRARVDRRKTKEACSSARLSRDSLTQRFALMRRDLSK